MLIADDGYKLTVRGYDYLALNTLYRRGTVKEVVCQIGVGKESDIYLCLDQNDQEVILKLVRLGRQSFRTVKLNRDYIKHRTSYNWFYLSRLAAVREYAYLQTLHAHKFPTPEPIDQNRHGIVMSRVDGLNIFKRHQLESPGDAFQQCMQIIQRLAEHGLIHSDFNEFNLMMKDNGEIVMIDFPQMVSTKHPNANFYFQRDVQCIHYFFERKYGFRVVETLDLQSIQRTMDLDKETKASGYNNIASSCEEATTKHLIAGMRSMSLDACYQRSSDTAKRSVKSCGRSVASSEQENQEIFVKEPKTLKKQDQAKPKNKQKQVSKPKNTRGKNKRAKAQFQ